MDAFVLVFINQTNASKSKGKVAEEESSKREKKDLPEKFVIFNIKYITRMTSLKTLSTTENFRKVVQL